jgi:hypothetical protein
MEFFDNKIDNELVSKRERKREREREREVRMFSFVDIHIAICATAP